MKYALLQDGLRYWRQQAPDRPALVLDDVESLSYEELGHWSDGIAEELQRLGVRPGDNVGISGANAMPWLPAAYGALKAGAVLVPYNDRFVRDEFDYLIGVTEPRIVIADAARAAILDTLPTPPKMLSMDALDRFRSGAAPGWTEARVDSNSVAVVVFTSGTTGRPKGVMLSHAQQLNKFQEYLFLAPGLLQDLRVLMPFGLYSAPGSAWGAMITSHYGGTLYFTRKFDARASLKTIAEHRISYLLGMPMIYEQVGRLPEFAAADLSALKLAIVGGARVSKEMTRAWNAKGVAVRQLYGMTEVGGTGIAATHAEALAKPDACGRGMMFTRVRVVDDAGQDCAANVEGHVLLRGPGMMVGYWRNPKATEELFTPEGWVRTGDIGVLDEEGYFFFVDRAKDLIISGGFNVSPSEIERVVLQIEGVVEVAAFAVPDEKFGEAPAVSIFASREITPQEVFAFCRERLAGFKLPRYVFPRAEPLPRMPSSKIDRRGLSAAYTPHATAAARLS